MSGSIPKAIIPPRETPGHLTFLKMIDQIPRYMGRFQGQMPHWLGLKSQNFHNLSGIDEYGTRIKCLSRLQRSGRFRVRKNFAFVFCGRKAFGGNIIKPGHLIRFVPFPFCYTPKQLQPAEGRF